MQYSTIKKWNVTPLILPLIHPFRTALGQHDQLENVLFRIELHDGTIGHGEAAIASHITGESVAITTDNLKMIGQDLLGQDPAQYYSISAKLNEQFPVNKAAVAAVEMALLDALTKQLKIPLWKWFGPQATTLNTDITIVIGSLDEAELSVKDYYRRGFRTFKVKVGKDLDLDCERVLRVKRFARNGKIIVDANQGYNAQQALSFLKKLETKGVRPILLEQPVPKADAEGLLKVARSTRIPVCADESAGSLSDVVKIIKEKSVGAINIKLMKFGILQAREAAILAKCAGIDLMMGGMMESPLAMTAAAHLAVGLGGFKFIDLDTPFFIQTPSRIGGLRQVTYLKPNGTYDLSKVKVGIGL